MSTLKKGFFWGNSTSSMQTEGAWDQGGKGLSVYDVREKTETSSDWKDATDSYHRYTEDFDFMKEMGMNCYRFQISWSRVCPTGDGAFNAEGIAFYDRFIDDLLARGITPVACLYHFDMPLSLAERYNGFVHRHVVDAFVRFGEEMLKRFGDKVAYWITMNEQNIFSTPYAFKISGYLKGAQTVREQYTISHHTMLAHARIANHLHAHYPNCQIGGMLTYMEPYPLTSHPNDVYLTRKMDEFLNHNLLEAYTHGTYSTEFLKFLENAQLSDILQEEDLAEIAKLRSDFLAFSYYASQTVDASLVENKTSMIDASAALAKNPYLEGTADWNWQIDPLGLRNVTTKIYNRYKLPVFVVENGIGVQEEWDGENEIQDDYRIAYHRDHIEALKAAVKEDGVDLIGYLGWGLIDILSSQGDMRKRYGMVYVNRTNHDLRDMKRVPKKSFYWMQKVTASNGEDL